MKLVTDLKDGQVIFCETQLDYELIVFLFKKYGIEPHGLTDVLTGRGWISNYDFISKGNYIEVPAKDFLPPPSLKDANLGDLYQDTESGKFFVKSHNDFIETHSNHLGNIPVVKIPKDFLPEEDDGSMAAYVKMKLPGIELIDQDRMSKMIEESRNYTNYQSSVNQMGEKVIQEIHGVGGIVRTIEGIYTSQITQGRKTILVTDKATWSVSTKQVNYIKIKGDVNKVSSQPTKSVIFHFMCGEKLSLNIIIGSEKVGEFSKYMTSDGYMYLIQDCNLFFEEEING